MSSNASRMNFQVRRPATAKVGYSGLNQEQEHGGSERGAMPTCGLDDTCCSDALQASLAQGQ
eukprot:3762345-Pleurochrysis_carterae.AAC.1